MRFEGASCQLRNVFRQVHKVAEVSSSRHGSRLPRTVREGSLIKFAIINDKAEMEELC